VSIGALYWIVHFDVLSLPIVYPFSRSFVWGLSDHPDGTTQLPTLANPPSPAQYRKLLARAKRKWLDGTYGGETNPNLPEAIHLVLDLRRTAYSAVGANNTDATPHVSPPDVNLSHLPAWAVQPLLGDLHNWFDLPAGLFTSEL
jgi:hypothetical protein